MELLLSQVLLFLFLPNFSPCLSIGPPKRDFRAPWAEQDNGYTYGLGGATECIVLLFLLLQARAPERCYDCIFHIQERILWSMRNRVCKV